MDPEGQGTDEVLNLTNGISFYIISSLILRRKLMKFKWIIIAVLLVSFLLIGIQKKKVEEKSVLEYSDRINMKAEPIITNMGLYSHDCMFDICSDNNSTVHFIYLHDDGFLHYGQIVQNTLVNEEVIPDSQDVQAEFQRPRILARPDGQSVHLTWMHPKPGANLIHVWKDSSGWHREVVWTGTSSWVSAPNGVEDLSGKMHITSHLWSLPGGVLLTAIKYWERDAGASDYRYENGWTLIESDKIKWRDTSMFIDREGGIHHCFKTAALPGGYIYCPSGGSLTDADIQNIPVPPGEVSVSFGDLFVDSEMNVHHAHLSYKLEKIWYQVKKAGSNQWTDLYNVSDGPVELCDIHAYENVWPGIAVGPEGRVYVTWVDMPCPDSEANRISLAIKENDTWTKEVLTHDGHITYHSKPAITANDNGVWLVWRDWQEELILYSVIHKELFLSTPFANQNICGDVDKIVAKVQVPSDFTKIEFYVDEVLLGEATAEPFEIDWDISLLELGNHTIKVIGYKTNGEMIEDEITVDLNCPPTVAVANLIPNASVAGIVDVVAKTSDDKGQVEKVEFFVDGKLVSSDSEYPYIYTWNTNPYIQGSKHNLSAVAYDESGVTDEETVKVTKFPVYPPIGLEGETRINRTLFVVEHYTNLTWQANPVNSLNIVAYRIYYVENGERVFVAEVDGNTFEFDHRNASLSEDEYVYAVTSVAGNGRESHGAAVILDRPESE